VAEWSGGEVLRDAQAGGKAGEVRESHFGWTGNGIVSVLVQPGEAASEPRWSHASGGVEQG